MKLKINHREILALVDFGVYVSLPFSWRSRCREDLIDQGLD